MITAQIYDSPCTLDADGNPSSDCIIAPAIQNENISDLATATRSGRAWLDRYGRKWRNGTATGPALANYKTGQTVQVFMADFGVVFGVISGVSYSIITTGDSVTADVTIIFRFEVEA